MIKLNNEDIKVLLSSPMNGVPNTPGQTNLCFHLQANVSQRILDILGEEDKGEVLKALGPGWEWGKGGDYLRAVFTGTIYGVEMFAKNSISAFKKYIESYEKGFTANKTFGLKDINNGGIKGR